MVVYQVQVLRGPPGNGGLGGGGGGNGGLFPGPPGLLNNSLSIKILIMSLKPLLICLFSDLVSFDSCLASWLLLFCVTDFTVFTFSTLLLRFMFK